MANVGSSVVSPGRGSWRRVGLAVAVLAVAAAGAALYFWRDALWAVTNVCLTDRQITGSAFPCSALDPQRGFAVLRLGKFHYLLTPTQRVTGIESAPLLAPDAENYFADAWQSRAVLDGGLGQPLPRGIAGMAVNSVAARTQDQLHIHIGCVRPDVIATLAKDEDQITTTWSATPFAVAGKRYSAMRVFGITLDGTNPFQALAAGLSTLGGDMASQTLVVTGATFKDGSEGFYLLASLSTPQRPAVGERLLDYQCQAAVSAATPPPPAAR